MTHETIIFPRTPKHELSQDALKKHWETGLQVLQCLPSKLEGGATTHLMVKWFNHLDKKYHKVVSKSGTHIIVFYQPWLKAKAEIAHHANQIRESGILGAYEMAGDFEKVRKAINEMFWGVEGVVYEREVPARNKQNKKMQLTQPSDLT